MLAVYELASDCQVMETKARYQHLSRACPRFNCPFRPGSARAVASPLSEIVGVPLSGPTSSFAAVAFVGRRQKVTIIHL